MAHATCLVAYPVRYHAGHRCRPHSHTCTEIIINREGHGCLYEPEQRYPFAADTLMVYQPGPEHWIECDSAGYNVCLHAIGCGVEDVRPAVYQMTDELAYICEPIERMLERRSPLAKLKLDLLVGLVIANLREQDGMLGSAETPEEQVRDLIDQRFEQQLSVGVLAEAVGLSPDHMRKRFRQAYGLGPIQYLINRRLESACSLLSTSDEPIADVAEECGFHSPRYFARMFRQFTGVTPSQYRKNTSTTRRRSAS